jgi:hypothetical protein
MLKFTFHDFWSKILGVQLPSLQRAYISISRSFQLQTSTEIKTNTIPDLNMTATDFYQLFFWQARSTKTTIHFFLVFMDYPAKNMCNSHFFIWFKILFVYCSGLIAAHTNTGPNMFLTFTVHLEQLQGYIKGTVSNNNMSSCRISVA